MPCASTPRGGAGRLDAESETLIPTNGGVFDVAHSLRGEGFDASEDGTGRGTPLVPVIAGTLKANNGGGGWSNSADHAAAGYMVPVHAFDARQSDVLQYGDKTGPLDTDGHSVAVAVRTANTSANGHGISAELAHTLDQAQGQAVMQPVAALFIQDDTTPKVNEERAGCLRHDAGGEGACVMTPAMQVRRLTPVECERLQGFPDHYTSIPWRGKPAAECPDGPRYKALGNSWAVPVVRWIGRRIAAQIA